MLRAFVYAWVKSLIKEYPIIVVVSPEGRSLTDSDRVVSDDLI